MKELYISPEANVIYFAPMESLASNVDPREDERLADGSFYSLTRSGVSIQEPDFGMDIS